MPDTPVPETEVSNNPSGPVITQEKRSTEVLDANGKSISGGESSLSKIFDKIADGSSAKDAVQEVMKKPARQAAAPLFEKKEEEVKEVDKGNSKPDPEPEIEPEIIVEKKAESKVDEVKKVEEKTEDKEEVSDADLQVLPHDKPKTAQRIAALLKKVSTTQAMADETKKEADAKAKRLQELEDQLKQVQSQDPLTHEKVKESLDELSMYRRRYDLENSQEVKEKFDGRVSGAEQAIHETLLKRGAPQSIVDVIKEEGGWLKFIDSNRVLPLANGKEMTAAELADAIKAQLPVSERRRLEALELEQIQTKRDRENYFNEETKKAKDYFANRDIEAKKQAEAKQREFDAAVNIVKDWRVKFKEENEWLKEKEISSGATPEQKAALEEHNKYAKQLNSVIETHLGAKDVNGMLNVLVEAVKYHQERRNLANALAENQKLKDSLKAKQDELDKFKKAGSPVNRSGSLAASSARSGEPAKEARPPSLEDAFAALEAGKSLDA